jgi:hypothetical protein
MGTTHSERKANGKANERRIKERSSLIGTGRWFSFRIQEIEEGE